MKLEINARVTFAHYTALSARWVCTYYPLLTQNYRFELPRQIQSLTIPWDGLWRVPEENRLYRGLQRSTLKGRDEYSSTDEQDDYQTQNPVYENDPGSFLRDQTPNPDPDFEEALQKWDEELHNCDGDQEYDNSVTFEQLTLDYENLNKEQDYEDPDLQLAMLKESLTFQLEKCEEEANQLEVLLQDSWREIREIDEEAKRRAGAKLWPKNEPFTPLTRQKADDRAPSVAEALEKREKIEDLKVQIRDV